MSDGSRRFRTVANIASSRGDASAGSSAANGSFLMMPSATDSASPVRPSANRQNARYSSACRRTSGALDSAPLNLVNVVKAASYEADAYRSFASRSESCAPSPAPSARMATPMTATAFMPRSTEQKSRNLLGEIDRDPVRPVRRHDDRLAPLAELRMPEDDVVRSDGHEQIGDRCLTQAVAVERDVGPRAGVDADRRLRRVNPHRHGLARGDVDRPCLPVAQAAARQRDLVAACREHDLVGAARADHVV